MICVADSPVARPLVLRMSVTDRCPLRCRYCMPAEGMALCAREGILSYEELADLVRCVQAEWPVAKVRLTGGEPLIRANLERLVGMLCELGVPDVTLTTNGQHLADAVPALVAAGLRRVNVSLPSLDADTFRQVTRGGVLEKTLAGIERARGAGLSPLKINRVVLRGVNEADVGEAVRFALERGCELRLLELMPMGPARERFNTWFTPWHEVHDRLAREFELEPLPEVAASSARRYAVRGPRGLTGAIGFISSWSEPFCTACNRLRVTAEGRLHGCLAHGSGTDVRQRLRRGDADGVRQAVRAALTAKRAGDRYTHPRLMACTGG